MTRRMQLTLEVTEDERTAVHDAIKLYVSLCRNSPDAPNRLHEDCERFFDRFDTAWETNGRWVFDTEQAKPCMHCGEPSVLSFVALCSRCSAPPQQSAR